MLKRLFRTVAIVAVKAWDHDTRDVLHQAQRRAAVGDPTQAAKLARVDSAWRREQVSHLRARQAAWRAVRQLARNPRAWLAQAGELVLFVVKLACYHWMAALGTLALLALLTSTPISEVGTMERDAASVFASCVLVVWMAWQLARLRLPFGSPFVDAWRNTYKRLTARE